tara:strand:+ start:98 stop:316 length:219 start_codon:yes stop_codon:yes gene_type:complete
VDMQQEMKIEEEEDMMKESSNTISRDTMYREVKKKPAMAIKRTMEERQFMHPLQETVFSDRSKNKTEDASVA